MKRSEMALLLATKLHDMMSEMYSERLYFGLEDPHAIQLLDFLEEHGMLPPHSGKIRQESIVDRWGMDTGKKSMVRVIVPECEDEKT